MNSNFQMNNKEVTYITGNPNKAAYLEKYLGHPIRHQKVDLDEMQSLDLRKVIEHKLDQAMKEVQGPVLVEDTALEFKEFGRLPGTFMKFFEQELSQEKICALLDGKDRSATARCIFGYFDGREKTFFEGKLEGSISETPRGDRGFGFNSIFIAKGSTKTTAELSEEEFKKAYMTYKPIRQVAEFLKSQNA
jgi:non-canonical purine NTP pyrophosphatase (RdgB/HAM1 family)